MSLTQQDFERSTKKYWLKNEYVDTFIGIIEKHLPIQVWNNRSASEITSVYFDNEDLRFYENRLLKKDGAALVRLRIYEGTEQVFVEKKVHYEELPSTKKRFFLQRADVDAYLAGSKEPLGQQLNSNDGEGGQASELYLDIQNLIGTNKMVPSIQTLYVRRAYQTGNDTGVRVTLDTNLRMGLMMGGKWMDQPSKSFSFPFSIMEIKLDGTTPEPDWLIEMKQRMELSKVSSFSKYVHGCYQLISSQACRRWSPTWWAFKDDQNCSSPLKFQPLEDISSRSFKKFCGLTQAIYTAVKFGMLDLLQDQPQSSSALSATLNTHPESTKVLLDFLAYFKLLRKDDRGDFHVTDKGDVLTTKAHHSFAQQALACGDMYTTFGDYILSELKGNTDIIPEGTIKPLDIIDSIICWNNSSMQTLLQSFIIVQAIYILVYFNIPHLIDNGISTIQQLSEKTKTDQTALKRFMKFILKLGLFSEKDNSYVLTRLSEKLLPSSSMRSYCLMCGNEYYKAWGALPISVKTGISAFESVFGMSLNQYLETNEQFLKYHTADQGSKTAKASDPILRIYDHSWAKNIVDIGGGDGAHLLAIHKKFQQSQGILLETPLMIDRCNKEQLSQNNIQPLAGDFFKSVPASSDLYILKKVLYCWTDDQCVQILKNVHAAMPTNGKAVVIDFMGTASDAPKLSVDNLWYLVKWGRPLRTEELYRKIYHQAGFRVSTLQQVNNDLYCFELIPVRKATN